MRGRKPKPVEVKKATGNPGKRSLGTLVPEPKDGKLICPAHVMADERAREYWDHYLGTTTPGHLKPVDSPLLATLCMALSRKDAAEQSMGRNMVVKAPNTGLPIQSPFLSIVNRQNLIIAKLVAQLALSPGERNRLGVHGETPDDPTAEFFD